MVKPILAAVIVMAATAGTALIEEHAVDIKTVGAVGAIVLTGTWSISRRFARIEDKLEGIKELQHRVEVVEKLILYAGKIPPSEKENLTKLDAP